MQNRYRLYQRENGIFYVEDCITGKQQSLRTTNRVAAERLLAGRNQSVEQPMLNRSMAKTYLSAKSPELTTRTWQDVMEHYTKSGVESTRDRKDRAFRSQPFARLRKVTLMDTEADHLFAVLEHKRAGNSAHHYLKRIHNYALHLGWLLSPVMADAAWPSVRKKHFQAITEEEHALIIAKETNTERRLYYELLWETGGSQSDIAELEWSRVDKETNTIEFFRQKLEGNEDAALSCLCIGPKLQALLDQLPQEGYFFPKIRLELAKHRASEFKRRCRTLKIKGRVLHSYRYAWAQRARSAGMPEREAMNHLGHKSKAIHAAYGRRAQVTTLPLEYYEMQKAKKIIEFTQAGREGDQKTVKAGHPSAG
ncbi:MAG TPA: tyrosine-type recombinase/integrase [Candidatus Methylacidiphilales bacterium]|nr:tyrosine-type recombinase/integrase [Candidatus Methylacidiphilales bacterium]